MRVVFMGSPDFALPSLRALLASPEFEVVGVVTQPDRPAGRGNDLRMPPVKVLAMEHRLPILQPEKLRGPEVMAQLAAWAPEVQVVAAYGQILRKEVLYLPPHGSVNVHASLLPRWRGAAPIQAAVRAGDAESGVTIMQMDEGLDTGRMLHKAAITLAERETGGSLFAKLAQLGGEILPGVLADYVAGRLSPQVQDEALVTYAGRIEKEEGRLDWTLTAHEIDRHVRAFDPAPGTFSTWEGKLLKILAGQALPGEAEPGRVLPGLQIGTGGGLFLPTWLQVEGKKRLPAADFLNGNPGIIGARLGE